MIMNTVNIDVFKHKSIVAVIRANGQLSIRPLVLTLQKSYTKGLLTLLTHRETSEAPAYFYRSCGRHP